MDTKKRQDIFIRTTRDTRWRLKKLAVNYQLTMKQLLVKLLDNEEQNKHIWKQLRDEQ